MPLKLLPMEEADVPIFYDIVNEAAKNDIMAVMYPNGFSKADKDFLVDSVIEEMRSDAGTVKNMKVIDTDLPDSHPYGKMVGGAKWKLHPKDRTDEEMREGQEKRRKKELPPGANVPFFEDFYGEISRNMETNIGNKAHVYLSLLATHPDHYRRGVGAMHVQWGTDLADELGLPMYVDSSPMGRPLYERMGYLYVSSIRTDIKSWGLDHDLPHTCLLRPARAANRNAS